MPFLHTSFPANMLRQIHESPCFLFVSRKADFLQYLDFMVLASKESGSDIILHACFASRARLTKVTVCQLCGARGFSELLIYCDKCQVYAIHRYCLYKLPQALEEYVVWFCVDCETKVVESSTPQQALPAIELQSRSEDSSVRNSKGKNDIEKLNRSEEGKNDIEKLNKSEEVEGKNDIRKLNNSEEEGKNDIKMLNKSEEKEGKNDIEKLNKSEEKNKYDIGSLSSSDVQRQSSHSFPATSEEHADDFSGDCETEVAESSRIVLALPVVGFQSRLKKGSSIGKSKGKKGITKLKNKKKGGKYDSGLLAMSKVQRQSIPLVPPLENSEKDGTQRRSLAVGEPSSNNEAKLIEAKNPPSNACEHSRGSELSNVDEGARPNTPSLAATDEYLNIAKHDFLGHVWRELDGVYSHAAANCVNTKTSSDAAAECVDTRASSDAAVNTKTSSDTMAECVNATVECVNTKTFSAAVAECVDARTSSDAGTKCVNTKISSDTTVECIVTRTSFDAAAKCVNTRTSDAMAESVNSITSLVAMSNQIPKLCYVSAQPIFQSIWRGSFRLYDENLIVGVVAHLSSLACLKVRETAKCIAELLCLELLPRYDVWPKGFKKWGPSDGSIALFFFPSDERNRTIFDCLVDKMIDQDLGMRAVVQDVELLIYTSKMLPLQFWKFQDKFYLWGVFRAKRATPQSTTEVVCGDKKNLVKLLTWDLRSPVSPISDSGTGDQNWEPMNMHIGYDTNIKNFEDERRHLKLKEDRIESFQLEAEACVLNSNMQRNDASKCKLKDERGRGEGDLSKNDRRVRKRKRKEPRKKPKSKRKKDISKLECYKCGMKGHFAKKCRVKD